MTSGTSEEEQQQRLNLLAEEQVLGIAMSWKGERGLSGLRAIEPEEFISGPGHTVIARNILDLANRGYHHDANAVSKLVAIRQQPMPWSFKGPLQQSPSGRQVQPASSSYLAILTEHAMPYETSLGYAAQVREAFRKNYMAETGRGLRQLGTQLEHAASSGKEDEWSITRHLDRIEKKVSDRIAGCPPSLGHLLKTSVGHDQLQKTLTAAPSLTSTSRAPATRGIR